MNISECIKNILPQMRRDKEYLWNNPEEEFKEIKTNEKSKRMAPRC